MDEEQLRQFETLKKNEIVASSDLKVIRAKYSGIEQDIVQFMQSSGSNTIWHHDQKKNLYYKLFIPDKDLKPKKRLPKKEDYVKWLEKNWNTLTRDMSRASPASFYDAFIEQAMQAPVSREGKGPKVHVQIKALTEEEFIKQRASEDVKKLKDKIATTSAPSTPQAQKTAAPPQQQQQQPQRQTPSKRRDYSDDESSSGSE